LRDDLLHRQHPGMRLGPGDVLGRQPFVEIDGGRYDLHDGSGSAFEPAAPHFVRNHETPVTLSRWQLYAIGALLAALALTGVLYGITAKSVHAPDASGPPAALAPFALAKTPAPVPMVAFTDASGTLRPLAGFKGHYVLLNLWATWCAPCVKELPALARLKAAMPKDGPLVIAVDVGRGTPTDARGFLDAHGAKALDAYIDSNIALLRAFSAFGLPLTVLIDPQGREIGRAVGPAHWDDPGAIAWFRAMAVKPRS
jgi:thiol-disulfide isomerase/thioredoxin